MVRKQILTKKGNIRTYHIKYLSKFYQKYIPVGKQNNRLIYAEEKKAEEIIKLVEEKEIIEPPKKRIRKQLTQSFRTDKPPYFSAIRVLTINPDYNKQALYIALQEFKKFLETHYNLKYKQFKGQEYVSGYEVKEINPDEDLKLNNMGVWGELFIAYDKSTKQETLIVTQII